MKTASFSSMNGLAVINPQSEAQALGSIRFVYCGV